MSLSDPCPHDDPAAPRTRVRAHAGVARAGAWAVALAAALVAAGCGTTPARPGADAAPDRPAGVAPTIAVEDTRQEAAAMRVSTLDARRVDRITGGVDALALQQVGELGYGRWLDAQLHPKPFVPPTALAERLARMRIVREPLAQRVRADAEQRKAADAIADDEGKKAARQAYAKAVDAEADEAAQRWLLYAVDSPNQLQERMVWFWVDHFNIGQQKADLRAYVGDYEAALRAHALGRFRDLLEAAALHPAMLRYLDNDRNAAGQVNENFARELLELHTLGVDAGYTQADVQETARVLTGAGVRVDAGDAKLKPALQPQYVHQGLFEFNPARHDMGDKTVFGVVLHADGGLGEVRRLLDLLARSPATARHVSAQLAQYFVGDAPPPALVDRLAQRYLATDGDIAAVLKTLFTSPEFDASLGTRFKDPWQYVVSATRLAYDGSVVVDAAPLLAALRQLGEAPFGHETPEGYAMTEQAWASPGQMTTRFDVARKLVGGGSGNPALFRIDGVILLGTPPRARVESAAWLRTQAPRASEATRQALLATLAERPGEWAWAALSSPEFMRN